MRIIKKNFQKNHLLFSFFIKKFQKVFYIQMPLASVNKIL